MKYAFMIILASIVIMANMPAQPTTVTATVPGLEALEADQWTFVLPVHGRMQAPQATFQVIYSGAWTAQAQQAFEYAMNLWGQVIVSPVPIIVTASWESLSSGVLGSAGPWLYTSVLPGLRPNTWYPAPLLNARAGLDLDPTREDIQSRFNSNANWYLGTDGNPPSGTFDFVSVVLHELGHGLGIVDSFEVINDQGQWGLNGRAIIYDVHVENLGQQQLIDTNLFANPSTQLGSELKSDQIYFDGTNANGANGGPRTHLHAPPTWAGGSSIAHLREGSYPAGSTNSLMTPAIGTAEAIHNPGPVARAMLLDLGWVLTPLDLPNKLYLPNIQK